MLLVIRRLRCSPKTTRGSGCGQDRTPTGSGRDQLQREAAGGIAFALLLIIGMVMTDIRKTDEPIIGLTGKYGVMR